MFIFAVMEEELTKKPTPTKDAARKPRHPRKTKNGKPMGRPPKYERRGGAREGCGRKPLPEGQRREPFTMNVLPKTVKQMQRLREKGINISEQVERMVDKLSAVLLIGDD